MWDLLHWVSECSLYCDRSNIVVKATKLLSTELVRLAFSPLCPLHMPESLCLSAWKNLFVSSNCENVAVVRYSQMTCFWVDTLTGDGFLSCKVKGVFLLSELTDTVALACSVWMHYSTSRPRWGYFTLSWTSKLPCGSSLMCSLCLQCLPVVDSSLEGHTHGSLHLPCWNLYQYSLSSLTGNRSNLLLLIKPL